MTTPAQLARRRLALAQPGPHRFAAAVVVALLELAERPKEVSMSSTVLEQAVGVYETQLGPASAEARATIERLVAESARFDLQRWTAICKSLVARGRRNRADLAAADYRRIARRSRIPAPPASVARVKNPAYQKLLAESRAAEQERAQRLAELLGGKG